MSLWDAWREWAAGRSTLDLEVWGLEVVWWGRLGKILQFVGALTVVLDIIGPERLIGFGQSLRSASPFAGTIARARRRWEPLWAWVRERRRTPQPLPAGWWTSGGFLVRLVLVMVGVAVALLFASWGWLLVVAVLFGGLVFLGVAAIVSIVGQGVFVLVIRPFARVISVPSVDAWAKSVGVVLLLAGFHFDLLAA